jgi:DNA polymerase V
VWAVVDLHETATLAQWAPEVEVYSIDAAFLDLTGISTEALCIFGQTLWTTIPQWPGIPVSVGIGPTKILARLANRPAPRSLEAYGVVALISSPEVEATLAEPLHGVHCGTPALVYTAGLRRHHLESELGQRNALQIGGLSNERKHCLGLEWQRHRGM